MPIANKPVIFYAIEQLVESGITDIGDHRRRYGGAGRAPLSATAPLRREHHLHPAGRPARASRTPSLVARDFLGESPFVLYLGDNFLLGGIRSYVDRFSASDCNSQILLHPVDNPEAFGIAELVRGAR